MNRLRLSVAAKADLLAIHRYISRDSHAAADRVVSDLESFLTTLTTMPERHPLRADVGTGRRLAPRKNYIVIYRFVREESLVRILRGVHSARDLTSLSQS